MQRNITLLRRVGVGAVFAAASVSLHAQDDSDASWNHLGLNFRAGFNIRAKFSEPGSFTPPPGPGSGLANHTYSDGYVNVDSSGNTGGQTWNWGYQHASQISGGDVLMHASGAVGSTIEKTDDPNLGFDLNYVRDIGHYGWGQLGIKAAFGYTHLQVNDSDPLTGGVETITDAYALNGITPPNAPYSGSASGPGPVIGSSPVSRSISDGGGVITGNHNIDASLFDLRLGPTVNIPLGHRFSFQGGGGLALGIVDSEFRFTEVSGGSSTTGDGTSTGFVAGAYAEAGIDYHFTRSLSVFTGAQFEYLGDFQQSVEGRSAQIKLGQSIFYELGLEWDF